MERHIVVPAEPGYQALLVLAGRDIHGHPEARIERRLPVIGWRIEEPSGNVMPITAAGAMGRFRAVDEDGYYDSAVEYPDGKVFSPQFGVHFDDERELLAAIVEDQIVTAAARARLDAAAEAA